MARIIHMTRGRAGGPSRVLRAALGVCVVVFAGFAVSRFVVRDAPVPDETVVAAPVDVRPERVSPFAATQPVDAPASPAAQPPADVACAFQRIDLQPDGEASRAVCVDATSVRQNGSVRSYVVGRSGADDWSLRIDVAAGDVVRASLSGRDGRRYTCEGTECRGIMISRHDARGARSITLHRLNLAAPVSIQRTSARAETVSGNVVLNGRLAVPADEQLPGLACHGPALDIATPDGGAHRFCGQGGAGFSIGDDGVRTVQFQDHEGQTLSVAVDAQQRVRRVEYGSLACERDACTGVSVVSASPDSELSERTFFFGRTALYAGVGPKGARSAVAPAMVLNGSIVLPSQE